ncbi:hypothetical protein BJ508DRAFT_320009 [Ascobolus immersus RN42]|uniref:Uncharacterized protein n=1 Tax=Ascobolus immersus RN42 TaxID=1160509 RepID=A0A3N4IUF8_ASCIM|nr:hypothetical protein BJ508DRAFT_320009 [Ascobolus immersus RN42]
MDSQGNASPGYSGDIDESSSSESHKHGHHLKETLKHGGHRLKETLKDAFARGSSDDSKYDGHSEGGVPLEKSDARTREGDLDEFVPISKGQEERLHEVARHKEVVDDGRSRIRSESVVAHLPVDDVGKKQYGKTKWPVLPSDENAEVVSSIDSVLGLEETAVPNIMIEPANVALFVPFIDEKSIDNENTYATLPSDNEELTAYLEDRRKKREEEEEDQSMIVEDGSTRSTDAPDSPNIKLSALKYEADPLMDIQQHEDVDAKQAAEEAGRQAEFAQAQISLDLSRKDSDSPKETDIDAASTIVETGSTATLVSNEDDSAEMEKRISGLIRKAALARANRGRKPAGKDNIESDGVFGDDEYSATDAEPHASHIGNIPDCPSRKVFKEASATVQHDKSIDRASEPLSTMLAEHLLGTGARSTTITPNPQSDSAEVEYSFQPSQNNTHELANMAPTDGKISVNETRAELGKDIPTEDASTHLKDPEFVAESTGKYASSDEDETDDEYRPIPVRSVFKVKGASVRPGPTLGDEYAAAKPLPVRDPAVVEKEREQERVQLLAVLQTPIEEPYPRPTAIKGLDGKFRCSDPRCSEKTYRSEVSVNVAIPNHHTVPTATGRPVNDILSIKPLTEKDRLGLLDLYKKSVARTQECEDLSRIGKELERGNIREHSIPFRSTGAYLLNNIGQMQTEIDPDFDYGGSEKENNVPPYRIDNPEKERIALKAFKDELPPYGDDFDEPRLPIRASEKGHVERSTPEDDDEDLGPSLIGAAREELTSVIDSGRNVLSAIFSAGKSIIPGGSTGQANPQGAEAGSKAADVKMPEEEFSTEDRPHEDASDNVSLVEKVKDSTGKVPLHVDLPRHEDFAEKVKLVEAAREEHSNVVESRKNEGVLSSLLNAGRSIIPVGNAKEVSSSSSECGPKTPAEEIADASVPEENMDKKAVEISTQKSDTADKKPVDVSAAEIDSSGQRDANASAAKVEDNETKGGLMNTARESISTATDTAREGINTAIDTVAAAIINAGKTIAPVGTFNTVPEEKDLKANFSGTEDSEDGGVRLGGDAKLE